MITGWVKLHRQFMTSRYGRNMEISGFFHTLLVMTNFTKGYCFDGTEIEPGQFMTSQLRLADHFNCSRSKIKRLLDILEADGQIIVKSSRYNSIITIVNWEKYQGDTADAEGLAVTKTSSSPTSSRTSEHTPERTQYKNAKKGKNNTIRVVKISSPLIPLFDNHSRATEIQGWLMAGELGPQKSLYEKYDPDYLVEVIEKAYDWQTEKKRRKAGRFISSWIERDNNQKLKGGLSPLQANIKKFFEDAGFADYAVEA